MDECGGEDSRDSLARAGCIPYGVFAVPTLVLLDAQGRELVEQTVGYDLSKDDYRLNLDQAIDSARQALVKGRM